MAETDPIDMLYHEIEQLKTEVEKIKRTLSKMGPEHAADEDLHDDDQEKIRTREAET